MSGHGTLIPDLRIRNFRCFDDLHIPVLRQVNLIVGKNRVGKSSVLEALRLYASFTAVDVMSELVTDRHEHLQAGGMAEAVRSLFFLRSFDNPITFGPETAPIRLEIRHFTRPTDSSPPGWVLSVSMGASLVRKVHLGDQLHETEVTPSARGLPYQFVGPHGMAPDLIARLWDSVHLTPLEDLLTDSLRLVAPTIERVSLRASWRVPFVRVKGESAPFPLRRIGDGLFRIFGIALAMTCAKDGLLLIDEFENGIHYSVHSELWKFTLQVSRQLNVQVFATTHSWDCVKAFQSALTGPNAELGMLTRLEFANGRIRASQFEESELSIATRESIEVR